MMAKNIALLLTLIALAAPLPVRAEMAVIVNKDNPLKAMNKADLSLIYFGKKKMFESGDVIVPIDTAPDKPARQDFFANILRKDEESYRLYWVRMIFSGKGQPPLAFKTEEEAVRFVASNKGGIAFVDSSQITGDVKMLHILENE